MSYYARSHKRCPECGSLPFHGRLPLTKRQREVMDFLTAFIADKGYGPNFAEIADRFDFSSIATVHEHLTNLEEKGWIRRRFNDSRSIELVPETDR